MKHSIRVPCDLCATSGVRDDEEGVFVCGGCMGAGWLDETPRAMVPEPIVDLEALRDGMAEGFDETAP